jgi:inositol phosphorylceramide mannosyltransferase catalytic subunit
MIKYIFSFVAIISISCHAYYTVHFETSLGNNDPYFGKYYKTCLAELSNPESIWTLVGTAPKPIDDLMTLCRTLYQKNPLPTVTSSGNPARIPRKIHQIWLGSPVPERYKSWQKTWQTLQGWEYKLWTDKEVEAFEFEAKKFYYASDNYGQRADIVRMAILEKEGGVYVDIDFECLNPEFFTLLNSSYDFYTSLHPLDAETLALENALIGSIPGHPVLKGYLKALKRTWKKSYAYEPHIEVVIKTGPGLFTRAFMKYGGKKHKDIVLPPTFFYPLGLKQWDSLKRFSYDSIKTQVLKPESAAIHWWHGTWKTPTAFINR